MPSTVIPKALARRATSVPMLPSPRMTQVFPSRTSPLPRTAGPGQRPPRGKAQAQERLAAWVKRGGVLVTTSQAANYDRYNEPCHVLDEVRGVREGERERMIIPNLGAVKKVGTVWVPKANDSSAATMDVYGVKGSAAPVVDDPQA